MSSLAASRLRRNKKFSSYAPLNKRGFSTAVKSRTIRKRPKINSALATPEKLLNEVVLALKGQGVGNTSRKPSKECETPQDKLAMPINTSAVNAQVMSSASSPVLKGSASNIFVISEYDNDMATLNLEGLTKEEKKRVLRESIAQLEEEEEDEELGELLAKHEELQKRKNSVGKEKRGEGKSKEKTERVVTKDNNEVFNTLDVNEFIKGNLPDITDIQNLLHVTDK